ncbi:Nuclease [Novosphingobium lubricantis]|uniref:Nuclease (SNase domain protein) n=1 Tax=Novosphingobium pentaromativorans US6-1 TaxID=1088721 RepID=G6EJQ8_9SPHN|nr:MULTISPECIES: thermonuclease family protein [Sphingomonadaceae]AIT82598.1 nuclease [Novosphingobium pentaromativorans US6-1]EHJ58442.1 nuclease (SNase domain protein) [Novosphingobium pentaromativorans US6-1]KKC26812.1 nuclease [Sphingomonas sp. SRS2]ODU35463.1 MAG: nuclease [Sphingopyxis sp. SCN 67-31]
MNRLVVLALLLAAASTPSDAAEDTSFSAKARALDGDTVATDFRLLGVDAFERRQLCERAGACWECGKAAQDLAARTLRGGDAQIRLSSRSSYGRPVATVSIDGRDLGEVMISAGLAIPQPQYLRSDPARSARYTAAFAQAQRQRAGAFAGSWLEPARWRRGERLTCER